GDQAKNSLCGQMMSRSPSGRSFTSGRSWVNMKNCSESIRATRVAGRSLTRWRKAPVAARPASIHPPNAMTSVVKLAGGSRSNSTLSMMILSAVTPSYVSKARLGCKWRMRPHGAERPADARDVAPGVVTGERESQLGRAGVPISVAAIEALAHGTGNSILIEQRVVDDVGRGVALRQTSNDALELVGRAAVVVTHRRLRRGRCAAVVAIR